MSTKPFELHKKLHKQETGRRFTSSVQHDSIWRIYKTTAGRKRALAHFMKMGYKYFVSWLDTKGYGLEAEYRADWQNDKSAVYHIR